MSPPVGPFEILTERLRLRPWTDADYGPFARLNADPKVMRHFPRLLTDAESHGLAGKIAAYIDARGWGLWAVELREGSPFMGFVGICPVRPDLAVAPAVEIAWRLHAAYWGRGYATEAARASLQVGFEALQLDEIVSFTSTPNLPSRRVMERLGMSHDGERFDHPRVPAESGLREHVVYRLSRAEWSRRAEAGA